MKPPKKEDFIGDGDQGSGSGEDSGWTKVGNFQYKTFELNLEDFNEVSSTDPEMRRRLGKFLRQELENRRNRLNSIRTTFYYEFYDENDDWYEDQRQFIDIMEFHNNGLEYNAVHTLKEIEEIINFEYSGGRDMVNDILKQRVEKNGRGKFQYLDTYAYYEARENYYIVYIQYKIKKV
jgi:hypothetical protein